MSPLRSLKTLHSRSWCGLASLGLVFLSGCTDDLRSSALKTEALTPRYQALTYGDGRIYLRAELQLGPGGNYLFLDGGDTFAVNGAGQQLKLELGTLSPHAYLGTLASLEQGLDIQIAFDRPIASEDAFGSAVRLPPAFEIEGPELNEIARGEPLSVSWQPEWCKMNWKLEGDCIESANGALEDNGSLTLDGKDLQAKTGAEAEECDVELTLDRASFGAVAEEFAAGGKFFGIQRRSVTFRSVP